MGRYANKILVLVGLAAAAVLAVEGFTGVNILNGEATSLLCVAAAVPPVIAALRHHSQRMEEALEARFELYAQRMERGMERHADVVTRHEAVVTQISGIVNHMAERLDRESAVWANSDTGPFPSLRKLS